MRIELWIDGAPHVLCGFPLDGCAALRTLPVRSIDDASMRKLRTFMSDLGVRGASDVALLEELSRRIARGQVHIARKDTPPWTPPRMPPSMPSIPKEENIPDGPVAEAIQDPVLVQVQWLEGDDATLVSGSPIQWVSFFFKEAKWVDGKLIKSIDRLARTPRAKVRFDKPGAHAFKLRLKGGASNAVFSGAEKGRNSFFAHQDQEQSLTTDGDGTKIIDGEIFVTCAGKDTWTLEAEDNKGVKKTSSALTTQRLVWYQEVKMLDAAGSAPLASITKSLATVKSEYAKHGICLEPLEEKTMPYLENISSAEETKLKDNARAVYSATDKEPYAIAISYAYHLANKAPNQVFVKSGVSVGFWKPNVEIPLVDATGNKQYLWNEIVTGEDWFVSAKFQADGSPDITNIPRENVKLVPVNATNPKMSTSVMIETNDMLDEVGTITLEVHCVKEMLGGFSFTFANLVCITTHSWWQDESEAYQQQVIIHELGHQFRMVSDGGSEMPDKPANHYIDRGHRGNHCHTGQALRDDFSIGDVGDCVMFGATHPKTAFCAECAPAIRKMDFRWGFLAF